MVPVSVVDANSQPVLGLKVTDFRVEELGREQTLTDLGNPDQVPLDIAILFDIFQQRQPERVFSVSATSSREFSETVMKPADRASHFHNSGSSGNGGATCAGKYRSSKGTTNSRRNSACAHGVL
jgi:hypothetical protein